MGVVVCSRLLCAAQHFFGGILAVPCFCNCNKKCRVSWAFVTDNSWFQQLSQENDHPGLKRIQNTQNTTLVWKYFWVFNRVVFFFFLLSCKIQHCDTPKSLRNFWERSSTYSFLFICDPLLFTIQKNTRMRGTLCPVLPACVVARALGVVMAAPTPDSTYNLDDTTSIVWDSAPGQLDLLFGNKTADR